MRYLDEIVNYGGEEMPRGRMIQELRETARILTDDPQRQRLIVDRYLQGFDLKERILK